MADSLVDTYRRNAEQAERYETTANTEEEGSLSASVQALARIRNGCAQVSTGFASANTAAERTLSSSTRFRNRRATPTQTEML
jgi:hypothetical protein